MRLNFLFISLLFPALFLCNATASKASDNIKLNITLKGVVKSKVSIYSIAEGKNNLIQEYPVVQPSE
jgi:hypothetical protein